MTLIGVAIPRCYLNCFSDSFKTYFGIKSNCLWLCWIWITWLKLSSALQMLCVLISAIMRLCYLGCWLESSAYWIFVWLTMVLNSSFVSSGTVATGLQPLVPWFVFFTDVHGSYVLGELVHFACILSSLCDWWCLIVPCMHEFHLVAFLPHWV